MVEESSCPSSGYSLGSEATCWVAIAQVPPYWVQTSLALNGPAPARIMPVAVAGLAQNGGSAHQVQRSRRIKRLRIVSIRFPAETETKVKQAPHTLGRMLRTTTTSRPHKTSAASAHPPQAAVADALASLCCPLPLCLPRLSHSPWTWPKGPGST